MRPLYPSIFSSLHPFVYLFMHFTNIECWLFARYGLVLEIKLKTTKIGACCQGAYNLVEKQTINVNYVI